MELPAWLAPLSGTLAMVVGLGLAGLWVWGDSLPEQHTATVRASIPVEPDVAWDLVSDMTRRPEWVEHVVEVVEGQVEGVHAWRQLDAEGDRFDFRVVEERRPVLVLATARTGDIGMSARWTWTVEPAGPAATEVTLTEEGSVPNPLFRASWQLQRGPYGVIEADLRSLVAALGAPDAAIERLSGP